MAAPIKNKNAEKWDIVESTELINKAIELSETTEYDFIGEIARKLQVNKSTFTYLSDKFPELKQKHLLLISNCEANCFSNGKKGKINTAMAIMNLKSNHGWTDRTEVKSEVTITDLPNIIIKANE